MQVIIEDIIMSQIIDFFSVLHVPPGSHGGEKRPAKTTRCQRYWNDKLSSFTCLPCSSHRTADLKISRATKNRESIVGHGSNIYVHEDRPF